MISGRLAFFLSVGGAGFVSLWILCTVASWIFGSPALTPPIYHGREYQREAFGSWIDADGDCLDTRAELLAERSLTDPLLDESGCRLVGGSWLDAYTGALLSDPEDIDVDHIVPLHVAWDAGAAFWDEKGRVVFMNDPRNLALTASGINRSKGDDTPFEWLPPDPKAQCRYVENFLSVLRGYGLTMEGSENLEPMAAKLCGRS